MAEHSSSPFQRRTRARITICPDLRAAFRGNGEAAIIPPVMVEDTVPA